MDNIKLIIYIILFNMNNIKLKQVCGQGGGGGDIAIMPIPGQ